MRRFAVVKLPDKGELCALPSGSAHHVANVLKLSVGTQVQLYDGRGIQAVAQIHSFDDDSVSALIIDDPVSCRPDREAHLLLALVKPKALDMALRMGTEVGLTHVHVFTADRSQHRPARTERWQRVMDAAARQCGRADTPTLLVHDSLAQALDALPNDMARYVALPGAPRLAASPVAAAAVVGPEGGLTTVEVDLALTSGCQPLGLGSWVLRADTAAILAAHHICM
jgi:16S rRNA (uracil1498-N3)-methyltransferase